VSPGNNFRRSTQHENSGDRLAAFWQALHQQQDPAKREFWLARWVFADDAVKLSLRPPGIAEKQSLKSKAA
jgi:hypothetical protein